MIFIHWKHYLIDISFKSWQRKCIFTSATDTYDRKQDKIFKYQILRQPFNWIEILLCDVTSWGFPVLKACTGKWNVTHQQQKKRTICHNCEFPLGWTKPWALHYRIRVGLGRDWTDVYHDACQHFLISVVNGFII